MYFYGSNLRPRSQMPSWTPVPSFEQTWYRCTRQYYILNFIHLGQVVLKKKVFQYISVHFYGSLIIREQHGIQCTITIVSGMLPEIHTVEKCDFHKPIIHSQMGGWSSGAMVLGKLTVPGRPTNLDYSKARAYCACSRCGWCCLDIFFSHLSFLVSFSLSLGDGPM